MDYRQYRENLIKTKCWERINYFNKNTNHFFNLVIEYNKPDNFIVLILDDVKFGCFLSWDETYERLKQFFVIYLIGKNEYLLNKILEEDFE